MGNDPLTRWYTRLPGSTLVTLEADQLARILPQMFGYYLLKMGEVESSEGLNASPILKQIPLNHSHHKQPKKPSVNGEYACLPIKNDSVDVVILQHVLEFEKDTQGVLEEAWRVLIPEGHMIIFGFNPWSLWGLWQHFRSKRTRPWSGKFHSLGAICQRLGQLGCDLVEKNTFFFRPPIKNPNWLRKLRFLEIVGKICWPIGGGIYMIVAKKKLVTLTPIRPRWRPVKRLGIRGVAEPSARRVQRD